jgi:hypothetical protein
MRQVSKGWWLAAVVLGLLGGRAQAASPYAGTWAATLMDNGQELTLWLLQIEDGTDGKPAVKVLWSMPPYTDTTVAKVAADAKALRLTLQAQGTDFRVTVSGKAREKTKQLLGNVQLGTMVAPLVLAPTEMVALDPKKAVKPAVGFEDWQKARRQSSADEKIAALKAVLEKYAEEPIALLAAQDLAELEVDKGDKAAARAAVERFLQTATPYGREVELSIALQITRVLNARDRDADLALEAARKAAELLRQEDSPSRTLAVLKTLATALRKAGKTDEVKALDARLAKAEEALDREFLDNAIPFKPEPFAGRKGKSDRVVVLELFTGAQCPPCVSADIAFDAALKAYQPKDVVLLQYHLHIPRPDPLTNTDSEARQEFYGNAIDGTPTMFLDGKRTPPLGGFRLHGKQRFETLAKQVNEELEKSPEAKVKVSAGRKGETIELTAEVADLERTGEQVRLRFALIEDVVRYPGSNGQRFHHHVVRAFPGGADGFPLKEKSGRRSVSLSRAELRKTLQDYLDTSNKKAPYPDDDRPLKLEQLKVVAFVQDDATKEILQAAQADVK